METLDELIEIYGRHWKTDDVAADSDLINLCKPHENVEGDPFHAQQKLVEKISRKLETTVNIQESPRSQVRWALRQYQRFVRSQNSEDYICLQLTRRRYHPHWTALQRDYFDRTSSIMATKRDYFLSFTQRHQEGAGNAINGYHRHSIQRLGQLPDPQMSPRNELAEMLHRFLQRKELRGFYFPTHEDDSKEVDKKLREALSQSLVFIQLVQNEMFSNFYPPAPNYCFSEYTQAMVENKRMILLFANGAWPADLIEDINVLFDFDEWYQFVSGAALMFLEPTRFVEEVEQNLPLIEAKLKDPLLRQVQNARNALWENAPADHEQP